MAVSNSQNSAIDITKLSNAMIFSHALQERLSVDPTKRFPFIINVH